MTHAPHITKIKQPKNNEKNNISKKRKTFKYQPLARALSFFSFLNAPLFSPSAHSILFVPSAAWVVGWFKQEPQTDGCGKGKPRQIYCESVSQHEWI
jgi:hypothetical protein